MIDETPSKDCDFLPASPANLITLSGRGRRAKRKLSMTRRKGRDMTKDKRTKLSFSSPETNISNHSLTVLVVNSSSPLATAWTEVPPKVSSDPQSSVTCPPAPRYDCH